MFYDRDTLDFEACFSLQKELDYDGIFLITAGTGPRNIDHVFLDQFALYNPE